MTFQYKKSHTHLSTSDSESEMLEKRLYLWASSRCSQKEYCRSELAQKMRTKGAMSQQIERLLSQLETERYIDEKRYAQAFVSDKFRFEHWGKIKIRYSLQQKGIPSSYINEALSNILPEEYQATLSNFITQRKQSTKGKSPYEINQKVARAAISRGFEPQLVFSLLKLDDNEW